MGVLHASAWSAEDRAAVETDLPGFLARYDVVLTTYGMAARMEGLQEVEFAAVVADEAQAIKTAGSARSRVRTDGSRAATAIAASRKTAHIAMCPIFGSAIRQQKAAAETGKNRFCLKRWKQS